MEEKNKLFVGNLPFAIDDAKLAEIFAVVGEVVEAKVIVDKMTGRSRGFGFVTMKDDETAQKAVTDLNDKEVEGRQIKVSVARPLKERSDRR